MMVMTAIMLMRALLTMMLMTLTLLITMTAALVYVNITKVTKSTRCCHAVKYSFRLLVNAAETNNRCRDDGSAC